MENYICINGKKAALTPEQLKALGIEVKENGPFERVDFNEKFYFIGDDGCVHVTNDNNMNFDIKAFNVANYCTDKALMEQRALHEILNRLLWRYSMEHDGDKIDWSDTHAWKFYIKFYHNDNQYIVDSACYNKNIGCVYFHKRKTAENAIKEIIEPFMKEHPEFKW